MNSHPPQAEKGAGNSAKIKRQENQVGYFVVIFRIKHESNIKTEQTRFYIKSVNHGLIR